MIEALILLLIALQCGDYWTTRRIIERGGREVNIVMLWWRDWLASVGVRAPFAWLVTAKAGVCVLLLVWHAAGWWSHASAPWLLAALALWYGWVVFNNARVLRGMGG